MEIISKIKALPTGGSITEAKFGAPWRELQHPILTDELLTLVTLIEQQSAVIEEAEKALEHYAENDNWCEADWNNPHHLETVYIGNQTEADRRHGYDIAREALSAMKSKEENDAK